MNAVIEQKLRDLWQESLNQNVPAVHVVTHLLLAHYLQGTQGDFAKWCCQYSVGFKMEASVEGGREALPGEFPHLTNNQDFSALEPTNPAGGKDWIC
jgi:hypothetical protein